MLDLSRAAARALDRIRRRFEMATGAKTPPPRGVELVDRQRPFATHLVQALRRAHLENEEPSPAPEVLFLAFPEALLSTWCELAYGPENNRKPDKATDDPDRDTWVAWRSLGPDTRLANFSTGNRDYVLTVHGLSPIADSSFLLADLGRAARAAMVLGCGVRVMLGDVSWIKHNRSIRQFGLRESEMDEGLRLCRDRRERLYGSLGVGSTVHSIVPYAKEGAINEDKLRLIVDHYRQLVTLFWGASFWDSPNGLTTDQVATLSEPLSTVVDPASPLAVLADFPGGLTALEGALRSHLGVVRDIAKRFNVLNEQIFSYFFAQYYAQDGYRGSCVKVAPITEQAFDQPFDEQDECFRAWGAIHEAAAPPPSVTKPRKKRERKMTATYLPQYSSSGWQALPYTPLSLDALRRSKGEVQRLEDNVLLLSDGPAQADKVRRMLGRTAERDVVELNRLAADLLSLVTWLGKQRSMPRVRELFTAQGEELASLLEEIHPLVAYSFEIESHPDVSLGELWLSWLESVGGGNEERDRYVPTHIAMSCLTPADWTEQRLNALTRFVLAMNAIGTRMGS